MRPLPELTATTYLQPLREGGSLPAVVETDAGLWVAKFRGAGQGPRALIAELLVGGIAGHLGLPVPELAIIQLREGFGAEQEDSEIRDLLAASVGANIGLRYMDGAFNFDNLAAGHLISAELAAEIVWLDAFLTNPDRTARNPNLMIWERRPWLIDHGSALYAHHAWSGVDEARTRTAFQPISQHVLLERASSLAKADARLAEQLDGDVFRGVLDAIPESLLMDPLAAGNFATVGDARDRYVRYLTERLDGRAAFVEEAIRAQRQVLATPKQRLETRR